MIDFWVSKPRRSNVQIMAEMLKVSHLKEVGKPEISSRVNINYSQLQRYLKRLLELRLLEVKVKDDSQVSYRITEKGKQLLNNIDSVQELLRGNRAE